MPEFRPSNAMAAIGKIRYLPPQTFIKALQEEDDNGNPWFYVRTSNRTGPVGTGWINSSALLNQVERDLVLAQMKKQGIATRRLYKQINREISTKYDITVEQLKKIIVEGVEKNWLMRP